MCIYTLKNKIKKKNPQGLTTLPNVLKLGVYCVKDTPKTNKDLGMSCYIQIEYSVFFCW